MSESEMELFLGWSPPEPLLEPLKWSVPSAGRGVVIPLDFYAVVGGPYRSAVNRWLQNGWPILWQISSRATESEILMAAVADANEEIQDLAIFSDELEIESVSRIEDWPIWSRVLYPKLFAELGETKFSDLILNFRTDFPMVSETPWLEFGYLSGYLRSQYKSDSAGTKLVGQVNGEKAASVSRVLQLAEQTAVEWAQFQALYSPMDEKIEAMSLSSGSLMVNPSAQILPLPEAGEVLAFVRRQLPHWQIQENRLDWMEAALLDELSESPRILRDELLATVRFEMESSDALPSIALPAIKDASWEQKLDGLIAKQIVIASPRLKLLDDLSEA